MEKNVSSNLKLAAKTRVEKDDSSVVQSEHPKPGLSKSTENEGAVEATGRRASTLNPNAQEFVPSYDSVPSTQLDMLFDQQPTRKKSILLNPSLNYRKDPMANVRASLPTLRRSFDSEDCTPTSFVWSVGLSASARRSSVQVTDQPFPRFSIPTESEYTRPFKKYSKEEIHSFVELMKKKVRSPFAGYSDNQIDESIMKHCPTLLWREDVLKVQEYLELKDVPVFDLRKSLT